ncbi:hypothetical protein I6F66_02610 [Pseudoalteromonas sp. NZS100_1]|uniref:hypothetical protein n=1 Tax=Pseudoalteromonas sp. NZS100_1 TaxID=2792073 RepID=UPI0018CF4A46|nr:hypothetical protein [Pseudoalteromonas sp. NZS100_1]MBH0010968.1 hypothetical protein [Pseudoalteromonas sp. NZS100_1]
MLAEVKFNLIKSYINQSAMIQNSSYLVDRVREMNLSVSGEAHYYRLYCTYNEVDGSSILFEFRSYDPSGPFQSIPDVNKIKLQLLQNNQVVSEIFEQYDDK